MDNEAVFQEYEKLAKRIKTGDDSAFSEMYEKSSRLVYGTCYGILQNEDDARDAMQETYMVCYQKIGELENDRMFLSWLKRIAATRSLNLYKKNHGDISYDDAIETEETIIGDDDLENLPDTWILQESEREVFRSILRSSLSDVQYQTILLYYFSELSVEAIADVMQCPVGTVKTRLKSARIKIKEGVEMYEEKTGEKMKVAMAMPFLGRFFQEEFKQLVLPPIDPAVILARAAESYAAAGVEAVTGASEASGAASAATAATSGATSGTTSGAATGSAAAGSVAGASAVSVAGAAKTSFLSTVTGKIVVLVSAIAILIGGGFLIKSFMKKAPEEKKKNPKIVEKTEETEDTEDTEETEKTELPEEEKAASEDTGAKGPAGSEAGASSDSGAVASGDPGLSGETESAGETAVQTYNQVGKVAVSDLPQKEQLSRLVSIFKSEYDHTDIPDDFVRSELVTSEYGARLPFEYYFMDFERGTGFTDPDGNFDKMYCGRIYMPFVEWAEEHILNISEEDRERINAEERFEVVVQSPTNKQGAYIGTDDFLYFWQGGTGNTESTIVLSASFDGEYYSIYTSSYDDFLMETDPDFDPVRDGVWRSYTMKLVEVDGNLYWSILDCHMMQEHDESVLLSE